VAIASGALLDRFAMDNLNLAEAYLNNVHRTIGLLGILGPAPAGLHFSRNNGA
jgi:hypothetical protein